MVSFLNFNNWEKQNQTSLYSEIPYDDDFEEVNNVDGNEVGRSEHIFNFVDVPSFVSLFSSSQSEPLYFVKVTEKEATR